MTNFNFKSGKIVYFKDEIVGGAFAVGNKIAFVPVPNHKLFKEAFVVDNETHLAAKLYMQAEYTDNAQDVA